jgi:hypothetical protein
MKRANAMKVIKSKPHKAPETIDSLLKSPAKTPGGSVDRVLVVYGEGDASIYYEPPVTSRPVVRPT